jgi:hypothetical protein
MNNQSYPPPEEASGHIQQHEQQSQPHVQQQQEHQSLASSSAVELEIICGPLLNYKRMSNELTESPVWHGSVLIVTSPTQLQPDLLLRSAGAVGNQIANEDPSGARTFQAEKLYQDSRKVFWRFAIDLPIQSHEARWEYSIAGTSSATPKVFTVPSKTQSMRILFHSCNGFSIGTDENAWSGPALWNDVLRSHNDQPFHVMVGGGDQIYNDNVRVTGPLKEWTQISSLRRRRDYLFGEALRAKCDQHYYENYVHWYSMEPFKSANCIIPQLNIWDDHDIIDGFGSYTDRFMRCAVFRGIGGVAHKYVTHILLSAALSNIDALRYYLLFQHHIAPPESTFTSKEPNSDHGEVVDPIQPEIPYVLTETFEDPMYIVGPKPGPYVEERSRSIYCQLGARIAFAGLDARLERTRHQVNYPETYDLFFNRLDREFTANSNLKHLILLLGVPIAYPRLQWLENIFSSPIIGPIRFLNKRFGLAGGFFNKFDGQVDLLDDLDDHYTARHHKKERKQLMLRLQSFSKKFSARVTILGGDVHLAAIGRFYSKPSLQIPAEADWRYMPNIISSAITNKPPPQAVANLLARRNIIHHLDYETDETLLEIFDHDPGFSHAAIKEKKENGREMPTKKTMTSNHCTMPSRNYAIIQESSPVTPAQSGLAAAANSTGSQTDTTERLGNGNGVANGTPNTAKISARLYPKKSNMKQPFHDGEKNAGTSHPAAAGLSHSGLGGEFGLDITLRVEISNSDREGKTEGYGFSIPGLDCSAYSAQGTTW